VASWQHDGGDQRSNFTMCLSNKVCSSEVEIMNHTCHKDFFKEHGLKNTLPRDLVWHRLDSAKQPVTIEWIFEGVQQQNKKINLSTVYRIIHQFVDHQLVRAIKLHHDKKEYFEKTKEHDHHFICVSCQTMIRLEECPLEKYEHQVTKKHHVLILDHTLQLYGYCQKCKQQ
jgi:Fe2+ or Zn2+ uptake regulation protein